MRIGIEIAKNFAQSGHLVIGLFGNSCVLALKLPNFCPIWSPFSWYVWNCMCNGIIIA
jgi:hypothetical protein